MFFTGLLLLDVFLERGVFLLTRVGFDLTIC